MTKAGYRFMLGPPEASHVRCLVASVLRGASMANCFALRREQRQQAEAAASTSAMLLI